MNGTNRSTTLVLLAFLSTTAHAQELPLEKASGYKVREYIADSGPIFGSAEIGIKVGKIPGGYLLVKRGVWFCGIIEYTEDKKCFFTPYTGDEQFFLRHIESVSRDGDTLNIVLKKTIRPDDWPKEAPWPIVTLKFSTAERVFTNDEIQRIETEDSCFFPVHVQGTFRGLWEQPSDLKPGRYHTFFPVGSKEAICNPTTGEFTVTKR